MAEPALRGGEERSHLYDSKGNKSVILITGRFVSRDEDCQGFVTCHPFFEEREKDGKPEFEGREGKKTTADPSTHHPQPPPHERRPVRRDPGILKSTLGAPFAQDDKLN